MSVRSFGLTLVALALLPHPALHAQARSAPRLALDPSRPYLEVVFQRAGRREPVFHEESESGAWFKLINNSIFPVTVPSLHPPNRNKGRILLYRLKAIKAVVPRSDDNTQATQVPCEEEESFPDVYHTTEIKPGRSITFSIPSEHLTGSCVIEIPFQFTGPERRVERQPRSFVEILWLDLPPEVSGEFDSLQEYLNRE